MSCRKENLFNETKRSGSKRKELLQRPKFGSAVCLNSTFASHTPTSRALSKANSVLLPAMLIHTTPITDYESLTDIEYSTYLQSLMFQQIISNQTKKLEVTLNDQLSIYTDTLSKRQQVADELDNEIKKHEAYNNIKELLHSLENQLNKSSKDLSPKVENKLSAIVEVLEQASNHLYLNKVRTLDNQEEYNLLEKSLCRFDNILTRIIALSGSIEKYQILGECVKRFKNILKEITTIQNQVGILQEDISKLTLETVSDILYHNTANEDEEYELRIGLI